MLTEHPGIARLEFQAMVVLQVRLLRGLLPDAGSADPARWAGQFVSETHEVVLRAPGCSTGWLAPADRPLPATERVQSLPELQALLA